MALKKSLIISLFLTVCCCFVTGQQVHYVTSATDNEEGSLRLILQQANAFDTIRFLPEIDTIFLSSGELIIEKSFFIESNENLITIKRVDTASQFRLFRIESEDTIQVSFKKIGFSGGYAPDGTEVTVNGDHGGAILISDSTHFIRFKECEFINNRSGDGVSDAWNGDYFAGKGGHGGAIYSNSRLLLEDCAFLNNFCGTGGHCLQIPWGWYIFIGEDGGAGGAIFISASMGLENCLFDANRAGNGRSALGSGSDYVDARAGQGGDGGAVFFTGDSLVVTSCVVVNNKAGSGGSASSNDSASTKKGGDGGGLYISGTYASISGSVFTGNISGVGGSVTSTGGSGGSGKSGGDGGAICLKESVLFMTSAEITGNQTGNGGLGDPNYGGDGGNGGNGGGISAMNSSVLADNCKIENNMTGNGGKAPGSMSSVNNMNGGMGGGIFIGSATGTCLLKSCSIIDNITGNGGEHSSGDRPGASGGHGGGVAYTGTNGITLLNLVNCDISLNTSGFARVPELAFYYDSYPRGGSGGGIYCPGGNVSLVNVTCTGNKAGSAYFDEISPQDSAIIYDVTRGFGGGILDTTGTSSLMNSLFAFNKIYTDSLPSENDLEGSFTLNYTLIREDEGFTFSGNDNLLNIDPLFLDFPGSRLLSEDSPAIDAGNPDTNNLNLPSVDLNGTPRFLNGAVDLGAYEHFPGSGNGDEPVQRSSASRRINIQCYPNPFQGSVVIEYELPEDGGVDLIIYDHLGQVVETLCNSFRSKGKHILPWNAQRFEPGIYLYRLTFVPAQKSGIQNVTGKLILIH